MEKKKNIKLSYESDDRMGEKVQKENYATRNEKDKNEFFNTTQNSE